MILRQTTITAPAKQAVLQKEFVSRVQSRIKPVYVVNEYPKSGGTWLKMMLAEALELPAWTKGKPVWAPCVMQGHWGSSKGGCRMICLFRDGRDVMVSYYYHSFFRNELGNAPLVKLMRKRFNFNELEDIKGNLLPFMKGMFDDPISPNFSWLDFVNRWASRPDVLICRYEDLRLDTAGTLCRLFESLTGENGLDRGRAQNIADSYTMQNMRKRKAELNPGMKGQENAEISFIRKGSVGGWSEHFTDESLEWFEQRMGDSLDLLGYTRGRPGVK
jgi:hypothetical protein